MIEQVPDVGFDVRLRETGGDIREAEVTTFMKPVSRPVDIHISGGKVYLVEHARELGNFGASTNPPGRILELSPVK